MLFKRVLLALAWVFSLGMQAGAQTPPPMFDVSPPGAITKELVVYLAGEAMNSRYVAVASRTQLAPANGGTPAQYQPYFTLYAQNHTSTSSQYVQIYQSPGANDSLHLLAVAKRPNGSPLYYPFQELTLVGAGEFVQPGVQQLALGTHEAAADCGGAAVYVLGLSDNRLVTRLKVTNACELAATVKVGSGNRATLMLTGPYYSPPAALCCPTKPKASAAVTFSGGTWKMAPPLFKIVTGA